MHTIIIGLLFVLNILLLWKYMRYKKYTKQLFIRSYRLEHTLIHIYNRCPEDVKLEITNSIASIKPL
jgi:hypothetical protein